MSETEQDDTKRRQRARFADALTTTAQQPGERSRLGARVAGAVAVLALAAGGTLGLSAWRSYQADEDAKKEKLAAEQAAARKQITKSPSATPKPSKSEHTPESAPRKHVSEPDPEPSTTIRAPQEKKTEQDVKSRSTANRSRVLLKNAQSGLCADLPYYDGVGETGTPVSQFRCDGTDQDNQLWDVRVKHPGKGPNGADLVLIRNVKDGYCLDLPDLGPKPPGTVVQEANCHETLKDNELWWVDPQPNRTLLVRNFASNNLCLKVPGPDLKKLDKPLVIGPCNDGATRWRFVR
ncbi:RICIN domain-containing protein [Streptomyces cacaoi]|uniref:RICIN domain-containing protein n=1 Tax=Streptomyces cacaoi TaxID=1898 RepID=UPI003749CC47